MKMAQGYVTDDGTFFESKNEAVLHEAESRLRGTLAVSFPQINADKLIAIIFEVRPEVKEYIDAYAAAYPAIRDQQAENEDRAEALDSGAPAAPEYTGHVSSTEEDLASLLKLPARGPLHVPDVGSGPRAEKVQDRREEHGPRVRRANAPDVRSRKDMAAIKGTEAGHARSSRGQTHLQKRSMESDME